MTNRPLLFIDVDGVLNIRRGDFVRRPAGARTLSRLIRHSPGLFITYWLNPAHEPLLRELADTFDLVWASAWEGAANQHVAARLGLPGFPFVDFGVGGEWNDPLPPVAARFLPLNAEAIGPKAPEVAAFAGGRDVVWVDDELGPDDVAFLQRVHAGHFWLYRIQEQVGLTRADFDLIVGLPASEQSGVLIEQADQLGDQSSSTSRHSSTNSGLMLLACSTVMGMTAIDRLPAPSKIMAQSRIPWQIRPIGGIRPTPIQQQGWPSAERRRSVQVANR